MAAMLVIFLWSAGAVWATMMSGDCVDFDDDDDEDDDDDLYNYIYNM